MAEIVNLRRARKAKARETAIGAADINRAAFGRTKAERATSTMETDQRDRVLDGARRKTDDA